MGLDKFLFHLNFHLNVHLNVHLNFHCFRHFRFSGSLNIRPPNCVAKANQKNALQYGFSLQIEGFAILANIRQKGNKSHFVARLGDTPTVQQAVSCLRAPPKATTIGLQVGLPAKSNRAVGR